MNADTQPRILADPQRTCERLIESFNSGSVSAIADLCHPALTVNSALLGEDRRVNHLIRSPLETLIQACHERFPHIQFTPREMVPTAGGCTFFWGAQVRSRAHAMQVPCSGRLRFESSKIREVWFAVDEQSILQQLDQVCADPGRALGRSAELNQSATEALRRAIAERRCSCEALARDIILHAHIETYTDVSRSVGTSSCSLEGAGKLQELLLYLHNRFDDPVEVTLASGVSQGHTTTFRGKIRGKVGAMRQTYKLICGFVSAGDRVCECWVKISPPPTLGECLV